MRSAGIVLTAILLAAPPALAAATVELQLGTQQVFVNEAFAVALVLADFQECDPPEFPELANCNVRQLGTASDYSQITVINGRRSDSHTRTYQYEITPHAVGELVIPKIPVKADGQVLYTRQARLQVRPSDADDLFAVEISTGRSRAYVGQRLRATMTIWVKPAFYGQQLVDETSMYRCLVPVEFGPFNINTVANPNTKDIRRQRQVAGRDELFYAYEFVAEFIPDRPGLLDFDNIQVGLAYPARGGQRNLRKRPTVQPCEVLPVPTEGRPAAFTGAVGLFDIKVSASPNHVRVGDPIELGIEVFGDGPVESLPPPLLTAQQRLVDDFRVPDQPLGGELLKTRHKRFAVTIRAKRADVKEIPAIEYPYFDPDAERFVIARSQPVLLAVEPAAEVDTPDVVPKSGDVAGRPTTQLQALDGLHDVETSETLLLTTVRPVAPRLVTAVMFVPPITFLVTWAGVTYAQRRTADAGRRRREQALRHARRRIAAAAQARSASDGSFAGTLASEIMAAMAGYLADRLNQPPARFTGRTALEYLRQRAVRDELIRQWSEVVSRCEEASFAAGAQANGQALREQALACLAALEREKL